MMKKLSLLVILSAFAVITYGQAKVELGLKGGLNVANINTESLLANYESATGYHVGAYVLVKALNIGIQPELLYSTRGTTVTFTGVVDEFKQEYVYMEVPVMLKFYLPLGLNIQAGPQFGALMSVSGEMVDSNGNSVKLSKDSYKAADASAALGLGWDLPFGLNVSARYVIGLSDIRDNEESKNRMFQLSAGFRLFKVGS